MPSADRAIPLVDHFIPPRRANTLAITLFLLSLTILFLAAMGCYFYLRAYNAEAIKIGQMRLPAVLWVSTGIILLSSLTMQMGLHAVRRERLAQFRFWVVATAILSALFCALQTPALSELWQNQVVQMQGIKNPLYGFMMVLIGLHAAHVIGGLVYLFVVLIGAFRGWYDHENNTGVRNVTLYWHFLDMVWLCMFFSLWIVR